MHDLKKNNNPLVSIIVPIYGVEKFIEVCANSIFNQTYDNIEFVFVDDCTPDNSIKELEKSIKLFPHLQKRIKIIHQNENKGLAAARHRGIMESAGEYLFHLDGDDWLEVDAIANCVKLAIQEHSDMCVCDFYINYEKEEFIQIAKTAPKEEYIKKMLSRDRAYSWTLCNRLIKREKQMMALPVKNLNMGEDYVTVPRILFFCDHVTHVNIPLYHYRQTNPNSYTKSISKKSIEDMVKATEVLESFFNKRDINIDYNQSLEIGRMKIKYDLFLSGNKDSRKIINNIFPDITYKEAHSISEKIIFILAQYKLFGLMDFVVKMGLNIKKRLK